MFSIDTHDERRLTGFHNRLMQVTNMVAAVNKNHRGRPLAAKHEWLNSERLDTELIPAAVLMLDGRLSELYDMLWEMGTRLPDSNVAGQVAVAVSPSPAQVAV